MCTSSVVLGTANVRISVGKSSLTSIVRSLCDNGSQINLITENCIQHHGIPKIKQYTPIAGIGSSSHATGYVDVDLVHRINKNITTPARLHVVARICSTLPEHHLPKLISNEIVENDLADNTYNIPGPIDILIGAGTLAAIVTNQMVRVPNGDKIIIAQHTKFGYIVYGQTSAIGSIETKGFNITLPTELLDLNAIMVRFWERESIPKARIWSNDEKRAEQIFVETHFRDTEGRFVVQIPMKDKPPPLGSSRDIAVACFHRLERRFKQQPDLYQKYRAVIDDYFAKGHLRPASRLQREHGDSYVIPHHPIHATPRMDGKSGKFRVVFNASARTSTGFSLNDQQLTGPKLQADLIDNFIRFRTHRYVLSADIVQMFRQIGVAPCHWNLQRIIWRDRPSDSLQEFVIAVVTWGMASAGFNAVRSLRQCAIDGQSKFPVGATVALNDFYYDDMHTGADNQEDLFTRYDEVIRLLDTAGFALSKWATNSVQLANKIKADAKIETIFPTDSGVLGMCWSPENDELSLKLSTKYQEIPSEKITKRTILSRIAQIYDPSGLIAPVIIRGKMLIQDIWKSESGWDELVSPSLAKQWNVYRLDIVSLAKIQIPRWIQTTTIDITELHIFSDAS